MEVVGRRSMQMLREGTTCHGCQEMTHDEGRQLVKEDGDALGRHAVLRTPRGDARQRDIFCA